MNNKLLVIISTSDAEKAQAGTMYAVNALKNGWMETVKLFFFGPAEVLLLEDKKLQQLVTAFQNEDEPVVVCKFLSDEKGQSEKLRKLGVEVEYVGEQISALIKTGYIPMVW